MKSISKALSLLLIGTALFTSFATANERPTSPTTQEFATSTYHEMQELNENTIPGIVLGYILLAALLITAWTLTLVDQTRLHANLNKLLIQDRARMHELGMDVNEIDRRYEELQRKKKSNKKTDEVEGH